MGGETEYALGATSANREAVEQPQLLRQFMDDARQALPYTAVSENGRFFGNGGLLDLDCGLHIEWATPKRPRRTTWSDLKSVTIAAAAFDRSLRCG